MNNHRKLQRSSNFSLLITGYRLFCMSSSLSCDLIDMFGVCSSLTTDCVYWLVNYHWKHSGLRHKLLCPKMLKSKIETLACCTEVCWTSTVWIQTAFAFAYTCQLDCFGGVLSCALALYQRCQITHFSIVSILLSFFKGVPSPQKSQTFCFLKGSCLWCSIVPL